MKKITALSLITLALNILLANADSLNPSYPCLYLSNHSNEKLLLTDDPNWDDQQLVVNGRIQNSLQRWLAENKSITICGLWNEFGLNLYPNGHFVACTIQNDDGSQLTQISGIYSQASFNYRVIAQSTNQLSLEIMPTKEGQQITH